MRLPSSITVFSLSATVILSGCNTAPKDYEQAARDHLDQVAYKYEANEQPDPTTLAAQPTPEDYLRFALLNHPQVAAAHAQWRARIAAINPARSLPDPKLTFQADIAKTVMSVMPGIMFDFMSTGKRDAMGRETAAGADVAQSQFEAATHQVATQVRKAWIELAYVEASQELHAETANSIDQSLAFAAADYATAKRGIGLGQQIELQNERAEHHVHHAILGDRLQAAQIAFKSALGLSPTDRDPPWPEFSITADTLPPDEILWQRIEQRNPELVTLRAMVEQSVAAVAVTEKAGTPDFSLGAMVDLKASPLMVRPTASLSLPIWRNRIADQIAGANAQRDASTAIVASAELDLAAQLARSLYDIHRIDRTLRYLDQTALPNLDRMAAAAAADYASGMGNGVAITEVLTRRNLLLISQTDLLRDRADAVTDLLFLSADNTPTGFNFSQN